MLTCCLTVEPKDPAQPAVVADAAGVVVPSAVERSHSLGNTGIAATAVFLVFDWDHISCNLSLSGFLQD